jgi:hypothetical protein
MYFEQNETSKISSALNSINIFLIVAIFCWNNWRACFNVKNKDDALLGLGAVWTGWRLNLEEHHHYRHRRENPKSHMLRLAYIKEIFFCKTVVKTVGSE